MSKKVLWILMGGLILGENAMATGKNALKPYRERRDLKKSHEPYGTIKKSKSKKPVGAQKRAIFVIQKHDASHLHYDVRLEVDGVLVSWAVPKGPSTDPADKRLAIQTEDHPMEYAKFEGIIPEGYGAGTVMVWDTGTYENIKHKNGKPVNMTECLKNGQIEVIFHGKKMHGAYALIKTHWHKANKNQWLLMKMKDAYADARLNLETSEPDSVLTGRTLEQIAAGSSVEKKTRTTVKNKKAKHTKKSVRDSRAKEKEHARKSTKSVAKKRAHSSGAKKTKTTKKSPAHAYAVPGSIGVATSSVKSGPVHHRIGAKKSKSASESVKKTHKKKTTRSVQKKQKSEKETIKVGTHTVAVSNLDKILFPRSKITKGELIEYYAHIADTMLAYVKHRPLTMMRFPNGIDQEWFYQKDAGDYFPKWIARKPIKKEGGVVHYVVCNNAATLVYLANLGSITQHIWLSRVDKLDYPDKLIFDLDPSGNDFNLVRATAKKVKVLLEELGLVPFVMTTGSRGLHVVVPIKRKENFDTVRAFTCDVAKYLVRQAPEHLTIEMRKEKRGDKVFIDYLRNAYGQTGVAPYAVRGKEDAPVATPLEWQDVDKRSLRPTQYTIKNIFDRLKKVGDPWKGMMRYARSIKQARKKIQKLLNP